MFYKSAITPKGNSSYSYKSQTEADERAAQLDANGCTGCTGCTGCVYCRHCTGCVYCRYCTGLIDAKGVEK